jgi:hypothetical protein
MDALCRRGSSGKSAMHTVGSPLEKRLAHLRPAGVLQADEQNRGHDEEYAPRIEPGG